MAKKKFDNRHDDSWLLGVQDVLSTRKPRHKLEIFANVKGSDIVIKIEYDNQKEIETIEDVYEATFKAKAFHQSFLHFIDELPSNFILEVTRTNCGQFIDEVIESDMYNARKAREALRKKGIVLINDKPAFMRKNKRK